MNVVSVSTASLRYSEAIVSAVMTADVYQKRMRTRRGCVPEEDALPVFVKHVMLVYAATHESWFLCTCDLVLCGKNATYMYYHSVYGQCMTNACV